MPNDPQNVEITLTGAAPGPSVTAGGANIVADPFVSDMIKAAGQCDPRTQCICRNCGVASKPEPLPDPKDNLNPAQARLRLLARVRFRQHWGRPESEFWCEACCVEWNQQSRLAKGYT